MRRDDPAQPPEQVTPLPSVAEEPEPLETVPARRTHLVAVVTRALSPADQSEPGDTLRERYWNPHERRWRETDFDSLESLRRRHIEESGWELLQEQQLDAPLAVELIFRAHRVDFVRPSREQILRDIGMTPDDVSQMLENVDRERGEE
jgi:hypothetical protein